jgi:hypothetical protein
LSAVQLFVFEPGQIEHILKAGAFPAGAAHRAIAPLNAWDMRLKKATAIARALTNVESDRGDDARRL